MTDERYSALTTVKGAAGYYKLRSAHKRSYFLNLIVCVLVNIGAFWVASQIGDYLLWYAIVLPITLVWIIFYTYRTLFKRRIRLRSWLILTFKTNSGRL